MYAFVDVETTGFHHAQDRIVEVAVLVYDGKEVQQSFATLVNPEMSLSPAVAKLISVREESLRDAPKFYEIARMIVKLTEGKIIVGHNVRFDYAFLRREFRSLGYHFYRKQLCTLRLSRKLLPGLPSYRLINICRQLNIPLNGHHRAKHDALAALRLFQTFQGLADQTVLAKLIEKAAKETNLPPALDQRQISGLPEDTGIYLFYDAGGRLLYVGKSKNIRRRVSDHFLNDLHSSRSAKMKGDIVRIRYRLTGSELVALLLESDLIKRHQPPYNRDQRSINYLYGLRASIDQKGYLRLALTSNQEPYEPILSFSNKIEAESFLLKLIIRFRLCQKLCHIHKTRGACFNYHLKMCNGACLGKESPAAYNQRVQMAIQQFDYAYPNFLIVGRGRRSREYSLVAVEKGVYQGFGFFRHPGEHLQRYCQENRLALRDMIQCRPDNQDVRRIIRGYLAHNRTDLVINY